MSGFSHTDVEPELALPREFLHLVGMKLTLLLSLVASTLGLAAEKKNIILIAGRPSHGPGEHEHNAGVQLLAKCLEQGAADRVSVKVKLNAEWPSAEEMAAANSILIYSDGGGGHPAITGDHLQQLGKEMKRGCGFVCLHYAVEPAYEKTNWPDGAPGPDGKPTKTPPPPDRGSKGAGSPEFLDWLGGYFEQFWSVNPHWKADFSAFPKHPISNGVKPFSTNDEWYYHMRFREKMEGVTPILTDLPPKDSLSRGDGPHSGNPDVRKAVLENKEPQHMAWATQRADGGRGFGCSGGHVHWNWGNNQFRKLILNAIVWTAGVDVPTDGVPAGKVTVDDLLQNHDEPIPADFNKSRIQAMLDEWNR